LFIAKIKLPMKKVIALGSTIASLWTPSVAFAEDLKITAPRTATGPVGYSNLGVFISNVLILAFSLAVLVVLVMLIWGAFEWITSGGDKDGVGKARGRIVNALIGLAVLAVAFALARVAAQFLGFPDITTSLPIPTPS
jgi:hypothetical protein